MARSVPSFMASCSAQCHYKQGTRTHHSLPDSMQGALITPLGPLTAPSGEWPDPTATSFPRATPKAVTVFNNFRPKVLNRRLNFDSNIKSSIINEK
ncbi:hypothetical protein E2C01_091959 [Portunus trituberculatus]|uniref:Uncharacterized protein n=1 Tax=Portunus trituberculatus TaxID=210409 RepID=A0A5B7JWI3_PORTR|nr:hypothetical protein [Portunus trituberculatus]